MQLLVLECVAERLYLKVDTVRRIIRKGSLKASKIGKRWLVSEADLNSFIESKKK